MEGFSLGQKIDNKCGMRASSTGELVFQDVKVPTENLLGDIGVCVCLPTVTVESIIFKLKCNYYYVCGH